MKSTAVIFFLGLFAAAATSADASDVLPYERELGSCVEAIQQNVDLSGVARVRHIVASADRDVRGYELTIDTYLYGTGATRKHEIVCLARGSMQPFKLRIDGERI